MKTLMCVAVALAMAGCSDSAREVRFPAMPEELADCKVFYVTNTLGEGMTVVRCSNSATSTQVRHGKMTRKAILVDGVEYVEK